MSNTTPTVAAGMAPGHDCAHNAAGEVMPPIDIIRAASAAADVIEAPLDAIEFYMSRLRTDWRGSAIIPAGVVEHYAEKIQSFTCIINDYRLSIEQALRQVERIYHDEASSQG